MKNWKHLWLTATFVTSLVILGAPAFAQDKQTIEKKIPEDLLGEWCFAYDDPQFGTHYQLPSWADTCDKHKILSIGSQWFEADDISCHPVSRIKVKIECANTGCGTSATFMAACTGTNRTWMVTIYRYKGNLDLKGLNR
jgi:hypothetical protein